MNGANGMHMEYCASDANGHNDYYHHVSNGSSVSGSSDGSITPPDFPSPAELVRIEAEALFTLATRLDTSNRPVFDAVVCALEHTVRAGRRLTLTGIGKSGLIARKIAATFTSLSLPAPFLHPAEALHGDLGLIQPGDAVIALSYSGESEELLRLLPSLKRLNLTIISFTGRPQSTLARASTHTIDTAVDREACTHQLAPTASTTAMLALGDALAITLAHRLGFAPHNFAAVHPGGSLGRRLTPISELMQSGGDIPIVDLDAPLTAVIRTISAKRVGMTLVQHMDGRPVGTISDEDLHLYLETVGPEAFHHTARDMVRAISTAISPDVLAPQALEIMEEHSLSSLVITLDGSPTAHVQGVIHLHDLLQALAAPVSQAKSSVKERTKSSKSAPVINGHGNHLFP